MTDTDVLVIGGGPAGSTTAAMLAQMGYHVTVCERDVFPRHHVGEALQPASIELLDMHLGLGQRIAEANFHPKFGALYEWGESNARWSVLFDKRIEADIPNMTTEEMLKVGYDLSYHVDRARFDKLLLDCAVEKGVHLERWDVLDPIIEDGAVVGLEIRDEAGQARSVRSRLVIDASGQRCFIGRRFGLVRNQEDLRHTAIYGYFEGCGGLDSALGRYATLVVCVPEGWVWFIPLSETKTSIGLVTAVGAKYTEEELMDVLRRANIPFGDGRIIVEPDGTTIRHARDWSYTVSRVAGDGWILCGDAAGFVDPILSGGVEFAVRGACNAAVAADKILSGLVDPPRVNTEYEQSFRVEQNAYLKLARYWYGNNRSVSGFFWEAHREIKADALSLDTPLRAFQYLTTGRHDADRHYKIFIEWQEQKIFQQLGVDPRALKRAIAEARRRVHVPQSQTATGPG
jgi:halogenation protein CepH